jgi:hypothetical protein
MAQRTHIKFRRFRAEPAPVPHVHMRANATGSGTNINIYVANEGGANDSVMVLHPNPPDPVTSVRTITAGVNNPQVIAVDAYGDVIVGNANSGGINGTITEYLAGTKTVCGTITGINNPTALLFSTNNNALWVGTKGDSALTEYYAPCTNPITNTPSATNQGELVAQFQNVHIVNPQAIVFQGNGMVTIADPGDTSGGAITTWDYTNCNPNTDPSNCLRRTITNSIQNPQAIVFDLNNNLWVADYSGNEVSAYVANGTSLLYPNNPSSDGKTVNPVALALEGGGRDHVLVANKGSNTVERIDVTTGTIVGQWGGVDPNAANGGQHFFEATNGLVVIPYPGGAQTNPAFYFVGLGTNHITEEIDPIYQYAQVGNDAMDDMSNAQCQADPDQCPKMYGTHFSPFTAGVGTPTAIAVDPTN